MSVRRVSGPGVKVETALRELDKVVGKTGYFETAKYEDGTPVAYIATIQEFGSPEQSIPPRPTMRPAAAANEKNWAALMKQGAKAALEEGGPSASDVMELVALAAAGNIRDEISALTSPALSPLTLLARLYKSDMGSGIKSGKTLGALAKSLDAGPPNVAGLVSTKPLVDTGLMFQSVTGVVEPKV